MQIVEKMIEVVEIGVEPSTGWIPVRLGSDISFSIDALRSYVLAKWDPLVFDALVVAAAIEFADRTTLRSVKEWKRKLFVRVPVHDVAKWRDPVVVSSLIDAISFLTGDEWKFEFIPRVRVEQFSGQEPLDLPVDIQSVIAYSDGMDSRAVAGIVGSQIGNRLLRVRVGMKTNKARRSQGKVQPFTGVPYAVRIGSRNKESNARNRGFKFSFISGIAAYLAGAKEIIVPESGQGAIGPALVTVAHSYPDYRNHPLFAMRMEKFLHAIFGVEVKFVFPRLWSTKAQTLREFVDLADGHEWHDTKTCWYGNNSSSVNGRFRNCGVCAACMLRRMSVHAAGLEENQNAYVTVNLSAETLEEGVDPDFKLLNQAFVDYGLAGVLSLQNLAMMKEEVFVSDVTRHAALLAYALKESREECQEKLQSLLSQHASEWQSFQQSLGERSFVNSWTRGTQ